MQLASASERRGGATPAPGQRERPRAHGGGGDRPGGEFTGLLWTTSAHGAQEPTDRTFVSDLNLDQVVTSIAGEREERELVSSILLHQLHDVGAIRFRQSVFRDLDDTALFEHLKEATELLRRVRVHLAQLKKMRSPYERQGWFLDAVAIYCDAVTSLDEAFTAAGPTSQGLASFHRVLRRYRASAGFEALSAETMARKEDLQGIRYCVRIQGGRVDVSRYEDDPDYSTEVLKIFERFKQGAVKDYRVQYRGWPGMNHVAEQILALVARLFPEEFSALDDYCQRHRDFFDPALRRFEREVQFYLAYLDYLAPLRAAGLGFCYPEVGRSKEVFATETFDLALAQKLVAEGGEVVRNDFRLSGGERIFVVSGPNQGGKTTFARTFGQLHHLASVGCLVPGSAARLLLFDRLFTHFEREEALDTMRGKLEDDLVRIREALLSATGDSLLVMNEVFSSTTLHDARFLGEKVLQKVIELDLLAVYVTFIDELATLQPSIVSMVSTVVPEDPAQRTFKVVRGPANGLAFALAIAEKYGVAYEPLRKRIGR